MIYKVSSSTLIKQDNFYKYVLLFYTIKYALLFETMSRFLENYEVWLTNSWFMSLFRLIHYYLKADCCCTKYVV